LSSTGTPSASVETPEAMEETQQILNITSVAPLSDLSVALGTALDSVGLPASVTVTLSDSTTPTVAVVWDNGMPTYDPNTAGKYVFSGTLTPPASSTNTSDLKSSINVIVEEGAPETSESESPPAEESPEVNISTEILAPVGEVISNASSSLLNIIWNFVNWVFHSSFGKNNQ
jgi:hypothetical protein